MNHNRLAIAFAAMTITILALIVKEIPEIGFAPIETYGKDLLKLAMFFGAWTVSLRFLGGWNYSVTEDAKQHPYGMTYLACALIIGCAMVLMK